MSVVHPIYHVIHIQHMNMIMNMNITVMNRNLYIIIPLTPPLPRPLRVPLHHDMISLELNHTMHRHRHRHRHRHWHRHQTNEFILIDINHKPLKRNCCILHRYHRSTVSPSPPRPMQTAVQCRSPLPSHPTATNVSVHTLSYIPHVFMAIASPLKWIHDS